MHLPSDTNSVLGLCWHSVLLPLLRIESYAAAAATQQPILARRSQTQPVGISQHIECLEAAPAITSTPRPGKQLPHRRRHHLVLRRFSCHGLSMTEGIINNTNRTECAQSQHRKSLFIEPLSLIRTIMKTQVSDTLSCTFIAMKQNGRRERFCIPCAVSTAWR